MWSWSPLSNGWVKRHQEIGHLHPEITWLPPQRYLHYTALYFGIYEWLRAPPSFSRRNQAQLYLTSLRQNLQQIPHGCEIREMQVHRIDWTTAWLACLLREDVMSDADTDDEGGSRANPEIE